MKRMMFLASIAAILSKDDHPDQIAIEKLNLILQIAYNTDALQFPMYIKKWLWKDLLKEPYVVLPSGVVQLSELTQRKLNAGDYASLAQFFKSKAPEWMVYGSPKLIADDLQLLIGQGLA